MSVTIGALDLGTTSSRFIIFDAAGRIVAMDQKEHRQIRPKPGWVEHDPMEIWDNTRTVIIRALEKAGPGARDIAAVGVTNQRETALIWDRETGKPYCHAIVWQCTRTDEICRRLEAEHGTAIFREKTGLPVATYFSGPKIRWILDHVPEAAAGVASGRAMVGTMDSWAIWWLTGGPAGGVHVTDVTNASRTLLMNIGTLQWDADLLDVMGIPEHVLPRIVPSIDTAAWGHTLDSGPLGRPVPVCGALGDQQAALVGQTCFSPGEAKNTYGTGCFLLLNTGTTPIASTHGMLTTVGYQVAGQAPVYCLEGSIAVAGALVQWLRDNIGMISDAAEIETLALSVNDRGGAYIVPAFSGLFAPYWRADARGVIAGLTGYVNRGHIARAVLEATAYQTHDIVVAMNRDSGVALTSLKVDGGMVANDLLMQFQSDILDVPVIRPKVTETTALGAAYAAGLGVGVWPDMETLRQNWAVDKTWAPKMAADDRARGVTGWQKAVSRTLDWEEIL